VRVGWREAARGVKGVVGMVVAAVTAADPSVSSVMRTVWSGAGESPEASSFAS